MTSDEGVGGDFQTTCFLFSSGRVGRLLPRVKRSLCTRRRGGTGGLERGTRAGRGDRIGAGGRSRRPFGAESGALFCPRVALRSPAANGVAPVATVHRPFGAKNDRTHFRPPNNQSYPPAPLMHKLKVTGIERDTSVYIKPVSNSFQLSGPPFYFHPKAMNDAD